MLLKGLLIVEEAGSGYEILFDTGVVVGSSHLEEELEACFLIDWLLIFRQDFFYEQRDTWEVLGVEHVVEARIDWFDDVDVFRIGSKLFTGCFQLLYSN